MDYRTMVNPTYLTAKSTVFMLAVAGNEDAKRMIAGLGLQREIRPIRSCLRLMQKP